MEGNGHRRTRLVGKCTTESENTKPWPNLYHVCCRLLFLWSGVLVPAHATDQCLVLYPERCLYYYSLFSLKTPENARLLQLQGFDFFRGIVNLVINRDKSNQPLE